MTRDRRRFIIGAAVAAGAAAVLYFVPPFRVVPLRRDGQRGSTSPFNAVAYVDRFWPERLIPGAAKAVDAAELVAAVEADPDAARRKYGHKVGLGGSYIYFVKGAGRVVSVDPDAVGLALGDDQSRAQISLQAGFIFGNATRDGTGLMNVSDFPNSQDFNAVSSELNRRVEERVLPELRRKAVVGAKLRFVGCAEVVDEELDLRPLQVVPFIVAAP